MASFRPVSANGTGSGDDKPAVYPSRTPVDTSHYLTSSSHSPYPTTTKTIDIQTDSRELDRHVYISTSASTQTANTSVPSPISSPTSQQLTRHQQQEIAKYIESKMKEQYMEQTRTLEQLQLQMKQQLQDKQAQLMQQITNNLDLQNGVGSANQPASTTPKPTTSDDSQRPVSNSTPHYNSSLRSPPYITSLTSTGTDAGGPAQSTPANSYPINTSVCNGNGSAMMRQPTAMTSSFSADESNTSQGSSHDTWDSTNAFTHERPVLTGSERSTPTPVLPANEDDDENSSVNDLELISQSVHIPLDEQDNLASAAPAAYTDANQVNNKISSNTADSIHANKSQENPVIPTSLQSNDLLQDETTPRKTDSMVDPVTLQADSAGDMAEPSDDREEAGDSEKNKTEEQFDELSQLANNQSGGSTPPPESPADDLSASLRFSLRQKHSRHISDMKAYYEQEMSDLKTKLTSSTAITQHELYTNLESENQKLRERCRILEEELLRANRYINSVDKQMEDLESSFNASLSASSKQHVKASTDSNPAHDPHEEQMYKNKLSQAEVYIKSLENKNSELFTALCDAYEVRDNTARKASQGNLLYDELKEKYEELRLSNDSTKVKLESTELCLKESRKDMESLKTSIKRLELEHQKLAKENELLRITSNNLTPQRNGSFNTSAMMSEDNCRVMSPMMKAEQQLDKSANHSTSPSKHRSRHHQYYNTSDRTRNSVNKSSNNVTSDKSAAAEFADELSPQPLSDATQSSDNSSRDHHHTNSKHNHHRTSKKSSHRHSTEQRLSVSATEQNNSTPTTQHFTKDDLITAYSPVVDRQRHSSSASSSGPAFRSANSPSRQSVERPYGYHHVGATMSPSKRTQQWAVLHVSPYNRTPERRKDRENNHQTTPLSAKKNLNFALNKTPESSPQKSKKKQEEVLEKVRTGKVFADDPEVKPLTSAKKAKSQFEDRIKLIRDAETRLDELLMEKRQLESSLTRASSVHSRKEKIRQENIEAQLDRVDKDLGSIRMTLRRYNAL